MSGINRRQRRARMQEAHQELEAALEAGDEEGALTAEIQIAFAQFGNRKFKEGMDTFQHARQRSQQMNDPQAEARVIASQILALQAIERLPDAFNLAKELIALGERLDDHGLRSDGLRYKGETLLSSGKPMEGFEMLRLALEAAELSEDPARKMAVNASLGHLSLVITEPQKADSYFDQALQLARQLGRKEAECSYLGNKGMVKAFLGEHQEASEVFTQALSLAQEIDNQQVAFNAHFHLAKSYANLDEYEQAIGHARSGMALALEPDTETEFSLLETVILSHYKLGQIDQAQAATEEAIQVAQKGSDRLKEVQMLISLGESFLAAEQTDKALNTYHEALEGAKKLERKIDEAHLIGRIAMTEAELGRLEEAVEHHQQSIELAQDRGLVELEADQRCLLALTYLDMNDKEAARQQCALAVGKYQEAELSEGIERAEQLLEQIDRMEE